MSRILVVDDDELVRELVVRKLSADGHEVDSATDGEEGLAKALADPPDLVVLDSMMPKLAGPDVCRRLREEPSTRGTKVVMLTARSQEADVIRGFAVGVDDYLVKPFSPAELVSRVRTLLGGNIDSRPAPTAVEPGDTPASGGPGPPPPGLLAAAHDVRAAIRRLDTALGRLVGELDRPPDP